MNAADHLPNTGRTQSRAGPAPDLEAAYRGRPEGSCAGDFCPCRGTIILEGRAWCTWHARSKGPEFPEISGRLAHHRDWLDLMGELMRIRNGGGKTARVAWVHAAVRFFAAEPDMHPTEHEREHLVAYLWRLQEELAYRVGVQAERPTPQIPQGRMPEFMRPEQRAIAEAAGSAGLPKVEGHERRQRRIAEYADANGVRL